MPAYIANLLLLMTGAIWGMAFVSQQTAMEDVGPLLFIGLRFLLAGLTVLPFALREQRRAARSLTLDQFVIMLPVGLAFFMGMALQQYGLLVTTVTNAGFLTSLYVIFVPLILLLALRERQSFIIWPAALVALFGIYLLSGGKLDALNWGDLIILLSAVFWAIQVILVGKISARTGAPVTLAFAQFVLCALLAFAGHALSPFVGLAEPALSLARIEGALPEILYAGVLAGGLAFTLQAIGQQYTSEAAAALFLSSESLFAALFGALLLGERLGMAGYIGCALIFSALLIVELRASFLRSLSRKA